MLLEKLKQEYVVDYIYSILNNKDILYLKQSLEQASELYNNCIFVYKIEYETGESFSIYDEYGEELFEIDSPYVNQYSYEDYLLNQELYKQLENNIKILKDAEVLIVLE